MATVKDLIDRVLIQLYEDTANPVHWTRSEIKNAIDEAIGVIHRYGMSGQASPDVLSNFYVTKSISLDPGTYQSLPDSSPEKGARFIAVHSVNDRSLTTFNADVMDAVQPGWIGTTGEQPRQYSPDSDRRHFWVYPGAGSLDEALIAYIREPEPVPESGEAPFESKYDQALIDYALYRAYGKDTEYAGQGGRAASHYQAFKDGINGTG